MPSARQRVGAKGEDAAAEWYERAGFLVVARNWACSRGELDLVVRRGGLVVFCEVKTRSTDRFGLPIEAITSRQTRRIRSAAVLFLSEMRSGAKSGVDDSHWTLPVRIRFDVVCVSREGVSVIEAGF